MNYAIRAIRRRLAIGLVLIGVLAAMATLGGRIASAQTADTPTAPPPVGAAVDGPTALPDVLVIVAPGPNTELHLASVSAELSELNGITWVARDNSVTPVQILVGLDPSNSAVGLRAVESTVADHPAVSQLSVAGRAVVDRDIQDQVGRGAFLAGVLASLVVGALVAWRVRPVEGLLAGAAVGLSALLASAFAETAAGPFDGSVATTSIPSLLAAILVSTYLVFRLLSWFAEPEGIDQADMIRRSVTSVAVELALFFTGLAVVAVFLEMVGTARSVAVVILAGAVVAAALTLAVLPPVLAALTGSGTPGPGDDDEDGGGPSGQRSGFVPFTSVFPGPDGRQCPAMVLVVVGGLMGLLALFSLQGTSPALLLDERAMDDPASSVPAGSGDPTAAIVARFETGVDQLAKTAWLERVSELPSVARVETSTGRYVGGTLSDVTRPPLSEAGIDGVQEAPELALVIPDVSGRSPAAQDLVSAIEATSAPIDPALSGPAVDALAAAGRDGSSVWLLMITLAVISGAAVFGLIGDPVLGAMAAGLRLLGSASIVGLYHLLTGEPTGSELQLVVLLTAVGGALFELGFLRRLLQGHRGGDHDVLIDQALHREGWAAAMGLVVAAVAALGLVVVDLAVIRRLGLLVVVASMIEVMVGMWMLRPPLLGLRTIRHFAGQPVRAALAALLGGETDPSVQQHWTEVVVGLLRKEFILQSEPDQAGLDEVFEGGTPLFRKAAEHHQSLAEAGLRILGREPQLRTVRVVGVGNPATVAVTVDHPPRQLVNQTGDVLGLRKPERRSLMLWLTSTDGGYRIADTVELGVEPLGEIPEPTVPVGPALGVTVDPAGR